jgi:hypothetical protein
MSISNEGRKIISLGKRDETESIEEPIITIDFFEILLPCRKFKIGYKVAERGAVSVTTEFLLRLLYSVDGMEEIAIAEFFGFDARELAFVLDEVTTWDYAVSRDGRVWLTEMGRRLFRNGETTPHILSVEKRSDLIGFDLFSLCPQDFEPMNRFDLSLPELIIPDAVLAASAVKRVQSSFHTHFPEIGFRRKGSVSETQQYLYSVDSVTPDQKFYSVVPVTVVAKGGRSSSAEVDLSKWKSGHELEDREEISSAVSQYLEGLKRAKNMHDNWAFDQLTKLAPDFLRDFMRQDGFAIDRYHKSAVARVGDLRTDRPTIPLIGSLFTPSNNEKLRLALHYGLNQAASSNMPIAECIHWLIPSGHWGHTRAMPATLSALKRAILKDQPSEIGDVKTIAWRPSKEKYSRLVGDNFSDVRSINEINLPSANLEVLWVPGLFVAAIVHAPIKSMFALPVPLGILSFDPAVVERAAHLFPQTI